MSKLIITTGLLICMATASAAASFRYTSATISKLDYFLQHAVSGFFFYDTDISEFRDASIVFDIGEPIRRNTTYAYNRASKNWGISLLSGEIQGRWIEDDDDLVVLITTGADRQVIDWNFFINVEVTGVNDSFTLRKDTSTGSYEFVDAGCVDEGNEEFDCFVNRGFRAADIGTWDRVPAVPLPASLPLLGAGLIAIGALRRRRS